MKLLGHLLALYNTIRVFKGLGSAMSNHTIISVRVELHPALGDHADCTSLMKLTQPTASQACHFLTSICLFPPTKSSGRTTRLLTGGFPNMISIAPCRLPTP